MGLKKFPCASLGHPEPLSPCALGPKTLLPLEQVKPPLVTGLPQGSLRLPQPLMLQDPPSLGLGGSRYCFEPVSAGRGPMLPTRGHVTVRGQSRGPGCPLV